MASIPFFSSSFPRALYHITWLSHKGHVIYAFAQYEHGARLLLEDRCETARATKVSELETMANAIDKHMDGFRGRWKYGKTCHSGTPPTAGLYGICA